MRPPQVWCAPSARQHPGGGATPHLLRAPCPSGVPALPALCLLWSPVPAPGGRAGWAPAFLGLRREGKAICPPEELLCVGARRQAARRSLHRLAEAGVLLPGGRFPLIRESPPAPALSEGETRE